MMTIGDVVELIYQAESRVAQAKRNKNVHKDIELIEQLTILVKILQQSLRESAKAGTN